MKPGTKVVVVAKQGLQPIGATGRLMSYALGARLSLVEWDEDHSVSTIATSAIVPWQQLKKAFKYGPKIVKRSR